MCHSASSPHADWPRCAPGPGPPTPPYQIEGAGSLVFGGIRKSPRNRAFAAGASLWSDIIVLLNLFICQSKPRDPIPAASTCYSKRGYIQADTKRHAGGVSSSNSQKSRHWTEWTVRPPPPLKNIYKFHCLSQKWYKGCRLVLSSLVFTQHAASMSSHLHSDTQPE